MIDRRAFLRRSALFGLASSIGLRVDAPKPAEARTDAPGGFPEPLWFERLDLPPTYDQRRLFLKALREQGIPSWIKNDTVIVTRCDGCA